MPNESDLKQSLEQGPLERGCRQVRRNHEHLSALTGCVVTGLRPGRKVHQWSELGEPGGELVAGLLPGHVDLGRLGVGEYRTERDSDVVGLGLGHVGEQVASEVDPAALVRHALEAAPQSLDEARVLV